VGAGWPGLLERHERFTEAVDIIQVFSPES